MPTFSYPIPSPYFETPVTKSRISNSTAHWSMRISSLLNNSMPLSVYICLLAYALLCSSISCFRPSYHVCNGVRKCGRLHFGYPFGEKGSGCGDPEFQLDDCHQDSFPLLNISGYQYRVLEPSFLSNNSNTITIINDNLWGGKCNLSGNYSQFWLSGSHFHIADTYTNLTLWRDCDEKKLRNSQKLRICDAYWYCFSIQNSGASFCNTHLEVPIRKFLIETQNFTRKPLQSNQSFLNFTRKPLQSNQSFLGQGFQITWSVNANRSRSCGACLKSNGSCGYNISKPTSFLCHCPDNTSHPSECPGRVNKTSSRSCVACLNSNGSCGYSISKPTTFLCHCPDNTSHPNSCPGRVNKNSSHASDTHHGNKTTIIIGASIGAGVALIAITLALFFVYYQKNRKPRSLADHFRKYERNGMEGYAAGREIGNLLIFSYEELCHATNGFHVENELGDGGFGSVYLGKLRDGRTVAIKRLYQDNLRRFEQFINEVEIFSSLNHPQLVRLFGCTSADSPELLLVYEFVPNGTLADHLHGNRKVPQGLPWNTRLNIAIQTAEALAFLHSVNPPILHRDVKSSNILLDENFHVKVADFGLCRLAPVNASHVTTAPQGTPGYVDPEYHRCYQLTEKSDVYSFAVVLVEIISSKLAMDMNRNRREINLADFAIEKIQAGVLHELVDPQLDIEINHVVKVMVSAVAELAFRCLVSESDDRPDMKEVVAELEVIKGLCSASLDEHWPGSSPNSKHTSSPTSPTSVQDNWPSINSSPNYST